MQTSSKNVQLKEHKQNGWEHFELWLKFNKIKYAACFIIDPDPINKQLSDLTSAIHSLHTKFTAHEYEGLLEH
jgi:hypothetical protein